MIEMIRFEKFEQYLELMEYHLDMYVTNGVLHLVSLRQVNSVNRAVYQDYFTLHEGAVEEVRLEAAC